jgi:hypothetical protein
MVELFGEAVETSRGGVSPQEVDHWVVGFRGYRTPSFVVLSLPLLGLPRCKRGATSATMGQTHRCAFPATTS